VQRRGHLIAIAMVALLAAACSDSRPNGPGAAGAGSSGAASSGAASSAPHASPGDAKLAFARCMRAHGVHDFPDPGSKVGAGAGGQLDPYDPAFEAAYQACQSVLPAGQDTLTQIHSRLAKLGLGFARCMRAHGIAGFPDPNADGQFPEAQMRELGKGSPQFTTAQDACQQYLDPASSRGGK
jgi:hypothetical protein